MQPSILFILFIGLIGGIAIGFQSPMASLISQRLGVWESIFIVHAGGAVGALIPMLVFGNKLTEWRSVPIYALGAGLFGLIVIFAMSFMIPKIGVAGALITLMAGQLLIGSLLDHFGLLGALQRPFDFTRAFGLSVVMLGVWLTVK
jgi:transporter family-2 protein